MHSQLYEGFDKTWQKDDAEWKLVVAASRRSAQATSQRRGARRGIRWVIVGIALRNIFRKRARVSWLDTKYS